MRKTEALWSQHWGEERLKVCIIGGGHIGTLIAGDLGSRKDMSIRVLTSKPCCWGDEVRVYDADNMIEHTGRVDIVSDDPRDVIVDANVIISTLPSHVFPAAFPKIEPFVRPGSWVGVVPGNGGIEFYCRDLVQRGCVVFGLQRVHGIARIRNYGESVYDLGKKQSLYVAAFPTDKTEEVRIVVENMLGIGCYSLPNYLNVTLAPSNAVLHTTRLYSMFHSYDEGMYWDRPTYFYQEWTDEASALLIACDEEMQELCRGIIGLDLSGVRSLKEYYESMTPAMMTTKLRSIKAFRGIETPMVETERGFAPDFGSRYFVEDFPYGLCIVKAFCDLADIDTPTIDEVLMWFERIAGVDYYVEGKFIGKDLRALPLPRNHGLNSVEDVVSFYA